MHSSERTASTYVSVSTSEASSALLPTRMSFTKYSRNSGASWRMATSSCTSPGLRPPSFSGAPSSCSRRSAIWWPALHTRRICDEGSSRRASCSDVRSTSSTKSAFSVNCMRYLRCGFRSAVVISCTSPSPRHEWRNISCDCSSAKLSSRPWSVTALSAEHRSAPHATRPRTSSYASRAITPVFTSTPRRETSSVPSVPCTISSVWRFRSAYRKASSVSPYWTGTSTSQSAPKAGLGFACNLISRSPRSPMMAPPAASESAKTWPKSSPVAPRYVRDSPASSAPASAPPSCPAV